MKRIYPGALLAVAAFAAASLVPARGQNGHGQVLVPESSIEQPGDRGVRSHTNHLILVGPAAGLGPGGGMTPAQLRSFYGLPPYALGNTAGGGVIAIVDAYDYPTALNDFNTFSRQFGLPQESSTSATASTNRVFKVVYASGTQPSKNASWALEEALDIEWAHAMAPTAKIVLVEAASNSNTNLYAAVDVATSLGASEVSMSWGGSESSGEASYDSHFNGKSPIFFASSGDTGGVTEYPSVSPYVIAAGGTSVATNSSGALTSESGWSGSGGGTSAFEPKPIYQTGSQNFEPYTAAGRAVPDVSSDADPNTGVAVYDATRYQGHAGWWVVGGTSAASPSLAGMMNLAGGSGGSVTQLTKIYSGINSNDTISSSFHDIISGTAGSFSCNIGWDFVTGVGSPQGTGGL